MSHWKRVFFGSVSKSQLSAAAIVVLLAAIVFTGYRFYSDRRAAAASAALASANTAQEYEQVIARYPNTPAGADAYILLAEAQRKESKFTEANKTLETFVAQYPSMSFWARRRWRWRQIWIRWAKRMKRWRCINRSRRLTPIVTLRRSPCFRRYTF